MADRTTSRSFIQISFQFPFVCLDVFDFKEKQEKKTELPLIISAATTAADRFHQIEEKVLNSSLHVHIHIVNWFDSSVLQLKTA